IFVTSHISKTNPDGSAMPYGPTPTNVEFTAADREKLRKLVDMGGTIWMDDCWLMRIDNNPANSFFLDLNFGGSSLAGFGGKPKYSAIVMDRNHPLLTSPFRLTDEEINHIGDKNVDDYRLTSLDGKALPDPILSPIVNANETS
ncbi:MAG TPA: hypothetical protein VHR86_05510, partial [Armatimonadota bacterium]|nr:hypothetical protein [Armatimonadota bacterium]